MDKIINKIHESRLFGRIFKTVIYCLEQELSGCERVLDLGCGESSPIKYCKNIKYSLGVEIFKPALEKSKAQKIHTEYLNQKIEDINFTPKSFDAVILIEVIEHLPKKMALEIIKKAESWTTKKIIITTPNGFIPQEQINQNLFEKHLSGFSVQDMKKLGFRVRGLAGLKCLRKERQDNAKQNLLNSIRFKPKIFWFTIATLSQLITYYFPEKAFELFCIKNYE